MLFRSWSSIYPLPCDPANGTVYSLLPAYFNTQVISDAWKNNPHQLLIIGRDGSHVFVGSGVRGQGGEVVGW